MLSLNKFLGLLPNVKPRVASKMILEDDVLSTELRKDIYERFNWFYGTTTLEVGPDAAAAIYELYKDGKLPMSKKNGVTEAPDAEAYLLDGDKYRAQLAEEKRCQDCILDLSLVRECDLQDAYLIDRIFWAHSEGNKPIFEMELAGIHVTKTVHQYASNSGVTKSSQRVFHWTGSDGIRKSSETVKPLAALNRRNDPERNWGLPE